MGLKKHLLVQSQQQDTRERSELCPKLTIKRVESHSGVFIVKRLSGSPFLCKYYYSKSKDEHILYLTSFKIAADFLNV